MPGAKSIQAGFGLKANAAHYFLSVSMFVWGGMLFYTWDTATSLPKSGMVDCTYQRRV